MCGRWTWADGKALVKKVGRTLDKLKSTVEINRILRQQRIFPCMI
jgi:hypothetical protein